MNDDRLELLLRGYELPEVPKALDRRVIARGGQILERARARSAVAGIAREFGNILGFGYLNYLVDLVTATDAEYRVDLV